MRIETWFFFFNSCSKGCVSWSYASHYIMWCVSKSWCATCDMHQSYDLRCLWHVPKLNSICHFSLCQGATLCSMWYTSRRCLVFHVVCIKAIPCGPCGMHQGDAMRPMWHAFRCSVFHVVHIKTIPGVLCGMHQGGSMWYASKWRLVFHMHMEVMPHVPCCIQQSDALCSTWNTWMWWYMFHVVCMKAIPSVPCGTH